MWKLWKTSLLIVALLCMPLQPHVRGISVTAAADRMPTLQYGEPVPWETVEKLFPRKTNAQVIDLETGLTFNVQRRAGSRHADVQPLTKSDTKIMKEIYNGKWSWKRKAVLVKVDGRYIAGSMNGMPHGAGAIGGNNFRGHFCIHFQGSSTHKKKHHDPGHQLMIWKASGQLGTVLTNASPYKLLDYFLTALKEQDQASLELMLDAGDPAAVQEFLAKARTIENLKRMQLKESKQDGTMPEGDSETSNESDGADRPQRVNENSQPDEPDTTGLKQVGIPVRLTVRYASQPKDTKTSLTVLLKRPAEGKPWKIDAKSVHNGLFSEKIPE